MTQNPLLNLLHFARAIFRLVIESVQMQETMYDVQLKLERERVFKHTSVSFGCLNADEDFTVLKSQDVSRTRLAEKLPMQP
jgi:TFIIF-interacting CTD phosphatase-like protein